MDQILNFSAYIEGEIPNCLNIQLFSPGLRRRVKYVTNLAHERNQLSEIHCFCNFFESPRNMEFAYFCVCDLDLAAQVLWLSW